MKQQEITDKARGRESAVHYMRQKGMTYKAIAERIGVSPDRVRQLLENYERHTKNSVRGLRYLSAYIKQLGDDK